MRKVSVPLRWSLPSPPLEIEVEGTDLDRDTLRDDVARSVMLVTALSPIIGYDQAATIAHHALEHDTTLREAALAHGVDAALFDRVVVPLDMTRPAPAVGDAAADADRRPAKRV